MKFETFKAGRWQQRYQYKSFEPVLVNHGWVSNDLIHWVRFFLQGVHEIANKGSVVFQQVLKLRTQVEQKILALGKRVPNARQALNVLYGQPMVTATDLQKRMNISQPTANALLKDLIKLGILREVTGAPRHRLYIFEDYLEIFTR